MYVSLMHNRSAERKQRDGVAGLIQERSERLLAQRGVDDYCAVAVEQQGRWTVFWGQVDSQATRIRLFSMVPEIDGERRIVDNLRIVAPSAAYRN
jgi:hypothetical protein